MKRDHVKRAEVQERIARKEDKQLTADIQHIMGIPAGRRLFMKMVMSGGIYDIAPRDAAHEYESGRRSATLEMMSAVNDCAPALVIKAREEFHATNAEYIRRLRRAVKEDEKHKQKEEGEDDE